MSRLNSGVPVGQPKPPVSQQQQQRQIPPQEYADHDPNGLLDDDDDLEEPAGEETKEAKFAKRLQEQQQQTDKGVLRAQITAELLSDPEMAAVYHAKRNGQQVRVVAGQQQQQQQQQEQRPQVKEPEDYEELSKKDLASHILSQVGTQFESAFQKAMGPILQKFKQVDQFVGEQTQKGITSEIVGLKQQYGEEFDLLGPEMMTLTDKYPDVSATDLFFLAKGKMGASGRRTNDREFESERPNSSLDAPPRQQRRKPFPPGRGGIKAAIAAATGRVNLNGIMGGGDYVNDDVDD